MCTSEWKGSIVMIKGIIGITSRMAGKTGCTIIVVSRNTIVLIIRFRIHMAGGAGKLGIVGRVDMAVCTLIPFALVLAAVDREILSVVIKGGRLPGGLRMAGDAICGEL